MTALVGCKKKEEATINFNQRSASVEKEDGWYYMYYIQFNKNDEGTIENPTYWFGGDNLKYKVLEDYIVPMYENGKKVGETTPAVPSLLYNKKYSKELERINAFLDEKKFTDQITVDDLELDLTYFKKEDIVELHNMAIQKENATEGKYIYLPESNIIQDELVDGYLWQAGYIGFYGNIAQVNIELIYKNDVYLSDLVEEGKATEEQKAIYNKIEEIEKLILEKQEFDQVSEQDIPFKV